MAVMKSPVSVSMPAAADLSASQFCIVAIEPANVGRVSLASSSTAPLMGILLNKPAGTSRAAEVAVSGVAKMIAGATVDEGDFITAVANGYGSATTTNAAHVVGIALSAAGSGGYFMVQVAPSIV